MNTKNYVTFLSVIFCLGLTLLFPELVLASVEGTLENIQDKLIGQIIPLLAVIALCFSAFSFFMGNPGARTHMFLAIMGTLIGLGAPSIIDLVKTLIH